MNETLKTAHRAPYARPLLRTVALWVEAQTITFSDNGEEDDDDSDKTRRFEWDEDDEISAGYAANYWKS